MAKPGEVASGERLRGVVRRGRPALAHGRYGRDADQVPLPARLEVAVRRVGERGEAERVRLDGLADVLPRLGFVGVACPGAEHDEVHAAHPLREHVERASGLVKLGHVHLCRVGRGREFRQQVVEQAWPPPGDSHGVAPHAEGEGDGPANPRCGSDDDGLLHQDRIARWECGITSCRSAAFG